MPMSENTTLLKPTELSPATEITRQICQQMDRCLLGREELHKLVLVGLLSRGHILLEGLPGLGKTALVRTIGAIMQLDFSRVQFTPDLMPGDVVGSHILQETDSGKREMTFEPGPVFTNILLADEINRASPKTQSAMLETMQERSVTLRGKTRSLPDPFFVIASQNPIEMEGTYPLPEAQLDRFMLNVFIDYLPEEDEVRVVSETTRRDDVQLNPVFSAEEVLRIQGVVRKVPVADSVVRYAVRLAASSRPGQKGTPDFVNEWVNWGAGLRAGQALILGGKARALLQGRSHVTPDDVKALAVPVLRHRILPNFKAEAEGVDADKVVEKLLETVRVP